MEKITTLALVLMLSGCSWFTSLQKPEHADKAIYKRYEIVMPVRPSLEIEKQNENSSVGELVRSYEIDLTNMMEYSLQLENLLAPIVVEEGSYEVEPIQPLPSSKPWYKLWN